MEKKRDSLNMVEYIFALVGANYADKNCAYKNVK